MKQKENTVRIQVHSETSDTGYYTIQVRRRWLFIPYWETICAFLDIPGAWNPVLLKYEAAKLFALSAKDQEWLNGFNERQIELERMYYASRNELFGKLYPTTEQKF